MDRRRHGPPLYRKARGQELTWAEVCDFLQPTEEQGLQNEFTLGWWKFCTGEEIPREEAQDYHRFQAQHRLGERERIIPRMAEYIDELVQR